MAVVAVTVPLERAETVRLLPVKAVCFTLPITATAVWQPAAADKCMEKVAKAAPASVSYNITFKPMT